MKGYNLPESTGPNDPEAPWNQEQEWESLFTCLICGREFDSAEEEEACTHTCSREEE
jgi:hypothetical protein